MASNPIKPKSFRYRNGEESNRNVLMTSQNQSTLRGFDVTDMSDTQVENMTSRWSKIQNQNWSLTAKESHMLKNYRPAKGRFKSFKTAKIRYYHTNG